MELPGARGLGFATLLLSVVLLPASSVTATPIAWTLVDVTFADGATASGTFSTDSTTGGLLSYDISTTAGVLAAEHYDGLGDHKFADNYFHQNDFVIMLDGTLTYIVLHFTNPLTVSGVNPLVPGYSSSDSFEVCDSCNIARAVTGGYATTAPPEAVPEPATLFLLGSGVVGLAAGRRRASQCNPQRRRG